jgi:putative aldouronate transport system permease protein
MLIPGFTLLIMFSIVPMLGIVIAFQHYIPTKGLWGSPWIGLDNFKYMFQLPDSRQIFFNTVFIAVMKIIMSLIVPLIFALMLNEVRTVFIKRSIQTIVYLPHFLSWVILGSIVSDILAPNGLVNHFLQMFGHQQIVFLGSNGWFPWIVIFSDTWKEFGFNTIVFLAALTGINPTLYEVSQIDGANRWKQTVYVTLPGLIPTIVLLATLSLGNVLNAGFDQVFNLYNPLVYKSGDIVDTFVYRVGLTQAQYGLATAVGLLKSVISFILIVISYKLASKYANYRIF